VLILKARRYGSGRFFARLLRRVKTEPLPTIAEEGTIATASVATRRNGDLRAR
jgi:hypothetical protein